MTFYVENERNYTFSFAIEELLERVALKVLDEEKCPYEVCVSLILTDNEGIREFNRLYRDMDQETDVLSFPGIDFIKEADFSSVEDHTADHFDPETGELMLGDMVISCEKAREQAEKFGHSYYREIAFLIAHSMFHLCGYDHMNEDDAKVMEAKQEKVLTELEITREIN